MTRNMHQPKIQLQYVDFIKFLSETIFNKKSAPRLSGCWKLLCYLSWSIAVKLIMFWFSRLLSRQSLICQLTAATNSCGSQNRFCGLGRRAILTAAPSSTRLIRLRRCFIKDAPRRRLFCPLLWRGCHEVTGEVSPPAFPPETGTLLSASQTFPLTGELPNGRAKPWRRGWSRGLTFTFHPKTQNRCVC